jgi:hypothetical protein
MAGVCDGAWGVGSRTFPHGVMAWQRPCLHFRLRLQTVQRSELQWATAYCGTYCIWNQVSNLTAVVTQWFGDLRRPIRRVVLQQNKSRQLREME